MPIQKKKQPDSQNENQAVKDELIAFYGDVKDDLTPDDIDDLMVAMRAKAERNKKKEIRCVMHEHSRLLYV